jgi:transcriptional regulator with XRE-family HTH domain
MNMAQERRLRTSKDVSVAQYAELSGISRQSVLKAIKDGRLSKSVRKNTQGHYRIKRAMADKEWLENTKDGTGAPAHNEPTGKALDKKANSPAEKKAAEISDTDINEGTSPEACPRTLNESRAWREYYAAEKVRVEFEKISGKLVNAAQVEDLWGRIIVSAKTKLMGLPSKAKQRIAKLTVEDVGILEELLREALEDLINDLP